MLEQLIPQNKNKNKPTDVILIVVSFLLVVGGVAVIRFYPANKYSQADRNITISDLPINVGVVPTVEEVSLPLISADYVTPSDIYNNPDVYNQNVIKLALIGDFASAKLKISGSMDNNLNNLLSIGINKVSGTIGGYRNSDKTLDLNKSTAVFNKDNLLENIIIDLQKPVRLSTTENEYSSTFVADKEVVFWNSIKSASLVNQGTMVDIILAPYSERGIYGDGTIIKKLDFVYSCKNGKGACRAVVCDKQAASGSECLRNNTAQ